MTQNTNNNSKEIEVIQKRMFPLTSANIPMPKVNPPKAPPTENTSSNNNSDKSNQDEKGNK